MYFEPKEYDGNVCRDGGLLENNPVQIAVNEARTIWGPDIVFDMVLSLGCGEAKDPQPKPKSVSLPTWLSDLFTALIATMNGNTAWGKFCEGVGQLVLDRSTRLNVRFGGPTEPELDDVKSIEPMEQLAKTYYFHYKAPGGGFAPVLDPVNTDSLEVLAARHKAALYFFELRSIAQQDDVSIIKGWICCRLRPDVESFKRLIGETSHFQLKGPKGKLVEVPPFREGEQLKLEVDFQEQASRDTEPIRIDVKFGHDYYVTISGFPMTLKVSSTIDMLY